MVKDGDALITCIQKKGIKYGRVFPKNSLGLFSIRREIIHTLARDNYIDIDVENCHPVILSQICENNNIEHKYLKRYIDNRADLLKEVMTTYNVTRDQAKVLFLQLLYFGSFESWSKNHNIQDKEPTKFIRKFKKELNVIGEIIVANNQKLSNDIEKNKEEQHIKDYNLKASVCSYFLQEYESRILECIYLYCKETNIIYKSVVLCADGLMIPKENYKDELLNEFKDLIKCKLGFNLNFTKKEMDQGYSIKELQDSQTVPDYDLLKTEFEKKNFKILIPLSFATIGDDENLIIRDRTEFKNVYENLLIDDESFLNKWLKDPNNRTYDKIDFLPAQEAPSNVYNTFKGFQGSKAIKYNVDVNDSLIMKHIREVISNNNQDVFQYIINFLANLLQHPHKKANTALIIKSVEGVGKDTIFNWFGNKILGSEYYFNDDSPDLLFGKFNDCIENKILCILNEASKKDTFIIDNKIKNAITREINTIEKKGKSAYKNTNNIGYVFLTNNDNPIKIPHDDRRFTGFECNHIYANNKEYFTNLYNEINSGLYDRAFYDYFLSIDLTSFDFTNSRPITNFYNNMKELNIPILARFFENIIDIYNADCSFTSTELFNKFNEYVKTNNFKVEISSTKFGIDIKNYDGIEKLKTRTSNIINIDILKLKQHLITKYKIEFCDFIDSEDEIEEPISPLDVIN